MKEKNFEFTFKVYTDINELPSDLKDLLSLARATTAKAYAPYSNFKVGAVARLANGETIIGTNQENASFPVGLCAERVLIASVSSVYPEEPIETIAISYQNPDKKSDHPVSPCGICRQTLQEYETRVNHPIQLVLGGFEGEVYVIDSAIKLLPLAFTSSEL